MGRGGYIGQLDIFQCSQLCTGGGGRALALFERCLLFLDRVQVALLCLAEQGFHLGKFPGL